MAAKDIEAGRERLRFRLQMMSSPSLHRAEQTMARFGQAVSLVAPIIAPVQSSIVNQVIDHLKETQINHE